jgi:2-amino-4-hydroxy-6-hydroxymethyldihydropteridine diphosphokinase
LGQILIGLGSNRAGHWGESAEALRRAVDEMRAAGISIDAVSHIYSTEGVGFGQPGIYANAAVAGDAHMGPIALLRLLKRLEARAGKRSAQPWGPRSLDLDIIDYKGIVRHWRDGAPLQGVNRGLTLPHAGTHERPFVLKPLLDIAPNWRHPVLQLSANQLWRRCAKQRGGRILESVGRLQ